VTSDHALYVYDPCRPDVYAYGAHPADRVGGGRR
jgi:hypothetical protein